MDLCFLDDTIAAVSTPPGQSGIGIVRLSGPEALAIVDSVFSPGPWPPPCGTASPPVATTGGLAVPHGLQQATSFTTHYGHIVENGEPLDEVLVTVMRAPRTYTREDVAEINCHGGAVPLRRVLELCLRRGARLAQPGEFTQRAFRNGRIDLAQAEAVADVIRAQTEQAQRAAQRQLDGALSERIGSFQEELLDLVVRLEAAIDFTDEDLTFLAPDEIHRRCSGLRERIAALIATADTGRILREGVSAVIVGRPNVGKSSLMNALLRDDRVIVTPIPGTTRDVVEDFVQIGGVPVRLADTAGLRETEDLIESEGVRRTRGRLDEADLCLLLLDGSAALTDEDRALLEELRGRGALLVLNKLDLGLALSAADLAEWAPADRVLAVSATERLGLAELEAAIERLIWGGRATPAEAVLVTNVRHKDALMRADEALARAEAAAAQGLTEEFVASDLREALQALGEIIGETTAEDVIARIFGTFCIGK